MEALLNLSVATAVSPQLAPATLGHASRGAKGPPAFAQVVHEAVNRAANPSAASQPAVPPKVSAPPNATDKVKKSRQSGRDKARAHDGPDGASAVNTVLLPSLLLALQVAAQNQLGQTGGSPLRNIAIDNSEAEPGMTKVGPVTNSGLPESAVASGDRAANENGATPATASGALAEQIQAQFSDVISAPLPSPTTTASVGDAPPTTGGATPNSQARSDPAGQPAGEPQAKVPTLREPELAPAVGDPLSSPQSQGVQMQRASAGTQSSASPAVGDPLSSLLSQNTPMQHANVGAQPLVSPPGDPLSSALSRDAQLKNANADTQPSAPPAGGTPAQTGSQSQQPGETQQASTSALASLPVLGTKPPVLTDPGSMPRGLQPAIDGAHAAAPPQVPSTPSSGHGTSQDASANHKGPTQPDAASAVGVAFPASATHDATGDLQSLAAGLPVKQDGAQAPATVATVVPSPPVTTLDHAAVAVPHQNAAAPAPLPSPEGPDVAANHFVNNAKLVEAAGHSEMRIAMETDKLGAVELRAHMVGDEVGAAITVEKRDAHAVLAIELPALQQALSDKQPRIEQVTLLHGSFSSTTGDASGSTKQDERSAPHAASGSWSVDAGRVSSMFGGGEQSVIFDSHGRLSVHA
jgi:hypothetical protein